MGNTLAIAILLTACGSSSKDDTGTTADTASPTIPCAADQATEVSARVHEEYGTLVVVGWQQVAPATAWVEYSFDDGEWRSTPPIETRGGDQEQPLLGIPYATEVTWRVAYECDDGTSFTTAESTTTTDTPPNLLPTAPTLLTTDDTRWDPDVDYVFTTINGSWSVIIDRQGRIVWARPSTQYTMYPRLSLDGRSLLIDEGTFWTLFDDGAAGQVIQTSIEGSDVTVFDTPGLFIGFTDLPDGSIAWPATGDSTAAVNDDTIEIVTPSGDQTSLWSCRDFWLNDASPTPPPGDYCAANTLAWSESRGSFLWTSFAPEMIIEIDGTTGETLRYFGHLDGAWGFEASSQQFWLPHGSHFTDAGTLLLSSDLAEDGEETIVIEYELDETSEELVEVWSFGEGEGIYGGARGEPQRLPGGNTLQNIGGEQSRLREVTPEGEVVWDVDLNAVGGIGGSSPITDIYALAR